MPIVQVEPMKPDRRVRPPEDRGKALSELLDQPDVYVVTPQSQVLSQAAHEKARAAHLQTLKQLSAKHRESGGRLNYLLDGFPDDPSPEVTTSGADGEPLTFKLQNRDAKIHDAVVASRAVSSRTNLALIYRELYETAAHAALQAPEKAPPELRKLPKPVSIQTKSASAISDAITMLVTIIERIFVALPPVIDDAPPVGYPAQCTAEEGTGDGSDMVSGPATLNPLGLRQNCNWPLKWYTTCVRNQGAERGTCSAFCVVAAAEARIAAEHNRWMNLSEQDLYKHCRHDWFPWPLDWYGDGFISTVSVIGQMTTGYVFPWERDWNYNRSLNRNDDDAHHLYTHSCDGYAGPCSDTNHQSHRTCSTENKEVLVEVVKTVSTWIEDVVNVVQGFINWITGSSGHWATQQVEEWENEVETFIVCTYDTAIPGTSGAHIVAANPFYAYGVIIGPKREPRLRAATLLPRFRSRSGSLSCPPSTVRAAVTSSSTPTKPHRNRGADTAYALQAGFRTRKFPQAHLKPPGTATSSSRTRGVRDWGDGGYAYLPESWVEKWATEMVAIPVVAI